MIPVAQAELSGMSKFILTELQFRVFSVRINSDKPLSRIYYLYWHSFYFIQDLAYLS